MTRWDKVAIHALILCCLALGWQNTRLATEVKEDTALIQRQQQITAKCLDVADFTIDAIDWEQQDVCE